MLEELKEELKEDFSRSRYEAWVSAMLDGKSKTTLQKYVKSDAKQKAKAMSDDELIDYLAKNWQ